MRLQSYREDLEDIQPDIRARVPKKRRLQLGSEEVTAELESVNRQYLDLAAIVIEQVNSLTRILTTITHIHVCGHNFFPFWY